MSLTVNLKRQGVARRIEIAEERSARVDAQIAALNDEARYFQEGAVEAYWKLVNLIGRPEADRLVDVYWQDETCWREIDKRTWDLYFEAKRDPRTPAERTADEWHADEAATRESVRPL